jgi:PQQ system protein
VILKMHAAATAHCTFVLLSLTSTTDARIGTGIPDEEVSPVTTAQERTDLLEELGLNAQNKAALGQVLGTGRIGRATERSDGRMEATIRIRPDEISWDPSILVIPHGGDIELTLINDDLNTHCALLPSNGDRKFIWLVNHSRGRATLNLDGPGYYWFSSPTGNDEGRGLTGAIVVLGDVPPEARLDRPDQPRP